MTSPGAACRYANQASTTYAIQVSRSRRKSVAGREPTRSGAFSTVGSAVGTAGGLPGLLGAAVRTADRGGDLCLEAVAALAPVQSLILRCRSALGAQAFRGPQVL